MHIIHDYHDYAPIVGNAFQALVSATSKYLVVVDREAGVPSFLAGLLDALVAGVQGAFFALGLGSQVFACFLVYVPVRLRSTVPLIYPALPLAPICDSSMCMRSGYGGGMCTNRLVAWPCTRYHHRRAPWKPSSSACCGWGWCRLFFQVSSSDPCNVFMR